MSTSKRRKGKQKVSFARTEPPPGDGNVIAFPSQGPRSIRPSDPGGDDRASTPEGAPGGRTSLVPDPVPEAAQRTSILEAEMADLVGDQAADEAPPPRASVPASVGLADGSQDDEDTQVSAVPPSPRAARMSEPGRAALEYEDDVTAVDASPLGSEPPPAGGLVPKPASAGTGRSRAPAASRDEHGEEPHEQEFFDSVPPHAPDDHFEDLQTERDALPVSDRKAMRWTAIIGAVGLVAIVGMLLYRNVFQPEPEQLGAAPAPTLPDPSLLVDEPEPEPTADEAAQAAADEAAAEAIAEPLTDEEAIAEGLDEALDEAQDQGDAPVVTPSATPEELAAIVALPEGTETPSGTYDELVELGREEERKSNFAEAERYFRGALTVEPQGAFALAHLGFILLNRGQSEDARAVAEYAVALLPSNSTGWITLGAARQALSDYPGAREAYRACAERAEGKYVEECRRMLR